MPGTAAIPFYIKRGLEADLPTLAAGELAYTTDRRRLYVGTAADGNRLLTQFGMDAKTANYTVVKADNRKLILCSNTITISLDPLLTLGADWNVTLMNAGSGVVTVDPNGAETILTPDGDESTLALMPGECVHLACSGGGLFLILRNSSGGGGGGAGALFGYTFDTDNVTPVASGEAVVNDSDMTNVSILTLSTTDSDGNNIEDFLATWDDAAGSDRGRIILKDTGDPTKLAIFTITGNSFLSTAPDRYSFFVTNIVWTGSAATVFSDAASLQVSFVPSAAAGSAGSAGPSGPPGIAGEDGEPGAMGPPGERGTSGAAGPVGATGQEGPPAFAFAEDGEDGSMGPPGDRGPAGAAGAVGTTGAEGPPAFMFGEEGERGPMGMPGDRGATGPQGLTGLTGGQGTPGLPGTTGARGHDGMPGRDGEDGYGVMGPPGDRGPEGAAGVAGAVGATGQDGPPAFMFAEDGEDGRMGPPGEGSRVDYILLGETQSQNVDAGTFTSGAWQTRALNVEAHDTGNFCTLSGNQFTLARGTYLLRASAPAYQVVRHQSRVENITVGTQYNGTSELSNSSALVTRSHVAALLVVRADTETFELQHRCQTTRATDGLGIAANHTIEVYAIVELTKIR